MRREREMWATGPTTCQPLAALRRIFFFYLRKPGTDRPSVFPVLPPCDVMSVTNAHWLAWAHRQLRSKTPLLAKNARNGAPQPVEGWLGSSCAQIKNPTSRKEREKWGTQPVEGWLGSSCAQIKNPTSRKEREKWGTRPGLGSS